MTRARYPLGRALIAAAIYRYEGRSSGDPIVRKACQDAQRAAMQEAERHLWRYRTKPEGDVAQMQGGA